MKTTWNSKGGAFLGAFVLSVAGLASACGGDAADTETGAIGSMSQELVGFNDGAGGIADSTCTPLLAGQTIVAGEVCISIDNEADTSAQCGAGSLGAIDVVYSTVDGWELVETHFAAGDDLADIPVNKKGNPVPGQFPYKSGALADGTTSWSVSIPLCEFGLDASQVECEPVTAFFASHAAVRKLLDDGTYQTETGWGDGDRFVSRGSWATFDTALLECYPDTEEPPPPPPERQCETSFAYGADAATCFIGADFDGDGQDDGFNRWGWSNGPLSNGSYEYEIYGGAGQCDLSKGRLDGTLSIEYAGSTAVVTYIPAEGVEFEEYHLYVGSEPLARNNGEYTVAPGQYPVVIDDGNDPGGISVTVEGLSGDIYVVAHSVSCQ